MSFAKAKIENLSPRYISIAGDNAYATPLGLLKSDVRGTVQLVVDVTLRAYRDGYSADPEISRLPYDTYFGGNRTPDMPFLNTWRIIDAFKLGTDGQNNQWYVPSDIEDLVVEGVISMDQLWIYNSTHRTIERPWELAVARQTDLREDDSGNLSSTEMKEEIEDNDGPGIAVTETDIAVASTKFQCIERLGEGAYGEAWRGHDSELRRDVAIKFVRSTGATKQDVLEQARAIARVTDPNIIAVYEVTKVLDPKTNTVLDAVVMELAEGASLVERLVPGLSRADALRIGTAILDAITAYHVRGLVHFDLHDGNVIVGERYVKIIDPIYFETTAMRSSKTRETQQQREIRRARDILVDLLRVTGVHSHDVARFEHEVAKPNVELLRREFRAALDSGLLASASEAPFENAPDAALPAEVQSGQAHAGLRLDKGTERQVGSVRGSRATHLDLEQRQKAISDFFELVDQDAYRLYYDIGHSQIWTAWNKGAEGIGVREFTARLLAFDTERNKLFMRLEATWSTHALYPDIVGSHLYWDFEPIRVRTYLLLQELVRIASDHPNDDRPILLTNNMRIEDWYSSLNEFSNWINERRRYLASKKRETDELGMESL